MSFQPLTREQYEKARGQFSHAEIMRFEEQRKQQSATPATPNTSVDIPNTPEKKPNVVQQIGQSALGSTLIRPAARATEAAGRLGVFGKNIQSGYEHMADNNEGQKFNLPLLGTYEVKPVKAGSDAARQIIGETLETASWLYGPSKAASLAFNSKKQGIIGSAKFLGKHGGIAGGMFGAGESMQDEEATAGDIAANTAIGAGAGIAGGAAFGAVMPVLPALMRNARGATEYVKELGMAGFDAGKTAAQSVSGMAKSAAEGVGNVPLRMGDRAYEAVQKAAERQQKLKNAPPHIREAMKTGVPDELVTVATAGNEADKLSRAEMIDIAKANLDPTYTGTGPRPTITKPSQVVGDQINNGPVRKLLEINGKGRQGTKEVLNRLPQEPQNFRNIFNQFLDDMREAGVVVKDGKLVTEQGSRVPSTDLRFYQQIYDDFLPGENLKTELTYRQLHGLRQKYFDTADSDDLFTQGTTSYAQRMRGFLMTEIDDASGGLYRQHQTEIAETLDAIGDYARLIGYKGRIEDITEKSLKAGEVSMRTLGTASDKPLSNIDKLYETAIKYGYEGDENIINQIRFADTLEDIYGAPDRSIGRLIARSTGANADPAQSAASSIREMVKWSPYSGGIRALRNAGLLGKRDEDIINAFERMVFAEAGRELPTQSISPIRESLTNIFEKGKEGVDDMMSNFKKDVKLETTPNPTIDKKKIIKLQERATSKGYDYSKIESDLTVRIKNSAGDKTYIDDAAESIVKQVPDADLVKAPLKSFDRSIEKIINETDTGSVSELKDIARNTIMPKTREAREAVIAAMDKRKDVVAKKPQSGKDFMGYEGIIYNIKSPSGNITETQVVSPKMMFGKMPPEESVGILGQDVVNRLAKETGLEPGYGHVLYEKFRGLTKEERLTKIGQDIIKESEEYYSLLSD